jgi:transposase
MLLVAEGRSCYEVARWFRIDARTIERWVRQFEDLGPDGLRDHPHPGRPARVNDKQAERLESDLAQLPKLLGYGESRWTGSLLARHLDSYYGIRLSVRQSQRLLRSLRGGI